MTMLRNAPIVQHAYVVNNLEEAAVKFHNLYGWGPFLLGNPFTMPNAKYRGTPAEITIRGGFTQSASLNIELIQVVSDGPNVYRDMFAPGEEGFHHVAVYTQDYHAERQALIDGGYAAALDLLYTDDCPICYIDTSKALGHMVELYPQHPVLHGLLSRVREASENWDGKDLIQGMDLNAL